MSISSFDIVLLCIILIFTIKVTHSGFVAEFFSKAAILLAGIGAIVFYRQLSPHVVRILGITSFPGLVSFLFIFLVVYLLVKSIQRIVGNAFENETMKNLDQALGFFLGIIEGVIVVIVVIVAMEMQPWFETGTITQGSLIYGFVEPFVFTGRNYLPVLINGQ